MAGAASLCHGCWSRRAVSHGGGLLIYSYCKPCNARCDASEVAVHELRAPQWSVPTGCERDIGENRRKESNSKCVPDSAVCGPEDPSAFTRSSLLCLPITPLRSRTSLVMFRLPKLASMPMQTIVKSMPTVHTSQQCICLLLSHLCPCNHENAHPAVCPFLVFASMS